MPHCIIEYSEGIEKIIHPEQLVNITYQAIFHSNLFKNNDIKTRAISYRFFQTGLHKDEFIHVTVRILSGRNVEQKRKLSNLILMQLKTISFPSISLTVEIVEIEQCSYAKIVI